MFLAVNVSREIKFHQRQILVVKRFDHLWVSNFEICVWVVVVNFKSEKIFGLGLKIVCLVMKTFGSNPFVNRDLFDSWIIYVKWKNIYHIVQLQFEFGQVYIRISIYGFFE